MKSVSHRGECMSTSTTVGQKNHASGSPGPDLTEALNGRVNSHNPQFRRKLPQPGGP